MLPVVLYQYWYPAHFTNRIDSSGVEPYIEAAMDPLDLDVLLLSPGSFGDDEETQDLDETYGPFSKFSRRLSAFGG